MIIRLNEHRFRRLFLTESTNSKKAHRDTRQVLARVLNRTVDDPKIIQIEQEFEKQVFGEGLNKDWFIVLEPYAAKWVYAQNYSILDVKSALGYIATKASSVQDRTAFMQQVKSIDDFGDLWFFIEKCKKEDRQFARNNMVEKPALNPNYLPPLGPLTFEEANKYGNKSGGNGSCRICYSQYQNTWNSYSNNGDNSLYMLLSKDWESYYPETAEHDGSEANNGLGDPYDRLNGYDNYGLSMIWIWVKPNGEISVSNTRWNHGGQFISPNVDQAFTKDSIQKLMGAPFESIFNVENVYEKLDTIEERLANGEKPNEIFDQMTMYRQTIETRLYAVRVGGHYNLLECSDNGNNLVFKDYWATGIYRLNSIGDLYCEFNDKGYVYTIENNLVLFFRQYVSVLQDRIQNGIKLDRIFQYVSPLLPIYCGLTAVGFNQHLGNIQMFSYNIITKDGRFLSKNWGTCVGTHDGPLDTTVVVLGDKENLMTKDGRFLFDVPYEDWYNSITYTRANGGIFVVSRGDGMETILRQDLSPITGEWYNKIKNTISEEGFCTVEFEDESWGYVNLQDGTTLGKGMNIICCDTFGNTIKGCGMVMAEDTREYCVLTKDNELFEYDDYLKHISKSSFLRLANGEKIEDVFSNSVVIGENIFVRIAERRWNLLNRERSGFVFPFYLAYVEPLADGSNLALVKAEDDNRSRYGCNVVDQNGNLLLNVPIARWFDDVSSLYDGELFIATLYRGHKPLQNIITNNGEFLIKAPIKEWPNDIFVQIPYANKYFRISKNNRFNYLDFNTGELLWKQPLKYWFTDVREFYDLAENLQLYQVEIGKKHNILSLVDGSLLWNKPLDKWFDGSIYVVRGKNDGNVMFNVGFGKKKNIIDVNGKFLWKKPLEEWFDGIGDGWLESDMIRVWRDKKSNLLTKNGKLVFKHWADEISIIDNNEYYIAMGDKRNIFFPLERKLLFKSSIENWPNVISFSAKNVYRFWLGKKGNIITKSGKLIWNHPYEEWFDGVGEYNNGYVRVTKDKKENLLSKNGKLLWNHPFKEWFDSMSYLQNGYATISKHKRYNLIDKNGKVVFKDWYDSIDMPDKGWCRVKKDGKYNFLNKASKPISKMWFDGATQFSEIGVTRVQIGDRCNIIDKNGNLLWDTLVKYWPVGHWGGGRIDSARNVYFTLMDINYHENRKKYYVTSDGKLSEVQLPFGKLKNDETT